MGIFSVELYINFMYHNANSYYTLIFPNYTNYNKYLPFNCEDAVCSENNSYWIFTFKAPSIAESRTINVYVYIYMEGSL